MIDRLKESKYIVKWTQWEYWPVWLAYLPVVPVILYYVAKSRRWFFFSNVNPFFKTGALMGASKYQILEEIPDSYKPCTVFFSREERSLEDILHKIGSSGLRFPVIAKPDVGERGLLVALIRSEYELASYFAANKIDIIIQEYVELPNECGIFFVKKPNDEKGKVVSVGIKSLMKLTGDGTATVRQLMNMDSRSRLQIERLEEEGSHILLDSIPEEGEIVTIEHVGNHCRGATFMDGNYMISDQLHDLFNGINAQMKEVYYGRFDVKYNTWEELLEGKNIRILEMNGIASEPIHVYDKRVPIRDKYKCFFSLWKTIYEISNIQKSRGYRPISLPAAYKAFREYKNYIKSLNTNWKVAPATNLGLA